MLLINGSGCISLCVFTVTIIMTFSFKDIIHTYVNIQHTAVRYYEYGVTYTVFIPRVQEVADGNVMEADVVLKGVIYDMISYVCSTSSVL